jgi:uncharacterized protein YkwD
MQLPMLLPILFSVLLSCTKSDVEETTPLETENSGVNKTLMLQLVNEVRQKGCNCSGTYYPPVNTLTWNDKLEAAALTHAADMKQKNYFSHTAKDGSNGGDRIQRAGYLWKTYGENIAAGYKTEREVVEGWISSPGHCKNIMTASFKEMGVARAGTIWAQEFGSR